MSGHPGFVTPPTRVEPVPRRIRGTLGGLVVFDTMDAKYVWEHPRYPQYWVPLADVEDGLLVPENETQQSPWGAVEVHGIKAPAGYVERAAKVVHESPVEGLSGHVRFDWNALDGWFEEDEQVFVHPRNPYVRVDALRSTRSLRVEQNGVLLAETSSPVLLFETGLPTRYYINRSDLRFDHLVKSDTVTACPYKGTTTGYWSASVNGELTDDVAWTYDFATVACAPIAGLVAFYHEKVDIYLDGNLIERP